MKESRTGGKPRGLRAGKGRRSSKFTTTLPDAVIAKLNDYADQYGARRNELISALVLSCLDQANSDEIVRAIAELRLHEESVTSSVTSAS